MGKAEFMNPGGSVKDRAALGLVQWAEETGTSLLSSSRFKFARARESEVLTVEGMNRQDWTGRYDCRRYGG